jgi:quercetin dioxygenase-like cupin family protein
MYTISDQIKNQEYNKLQVNKLVRTDSLEILNISLEKGAVFPEHIALTDAQLIVLEGEIVFHIQGRSYTIKEQQHFSFPKEVPHWVSAKENSKFLIIR